MVEALQTFAAKGCADDKGALSILPTWHKYLSGTEKDGYCNLNFAFPQDITAILLAVVEILLRVGAIVAVGFVIYGGFMFMLSRGEPDKAANARRGIVNALIGLVIAIFATGIVSFIGSRLA